MTPAGAGSVAVAGTFVDVIRTLLRPSALVSHLVVIAVVAVLASLGQWQFQRLDERREQNARFEERLAAAPLDAVDLARDAGLAGADAGTVGELGDGALEYRRVTATGTYLADEELLLEGREFQGQTGRDSFVPLQLEDGSLVLVRRGWVPRELGPPPLAEAAPPTGTVTVTGYLERSVPEPRIGPRNLETGELTILQVPDVDRIAGQLPGPVLPMLLTATAQDPAPVASEAAAARGLDGLPALRAEEPFSEGSHLSYGLQWWSFALLALIAYVAFWVKRLRGDDREGAAPDTAPGAADGPAAEPARSGQPPS